MYLVLVRVPFEVLKLGETFLKSFVGGHCLEGEDDVRLFAFFHWASQQRGGLRQPAHSPHRSSARISWIASARYAD
jgi:hypothetical protein